MGRKLDIDSLTDEEQQRILEVIQRDFELRKKEDDRLGTLNKMAVLRATSPIINAEPDTHCFICGEPFLWLFRPKVECFNCNVFVCKNKHSCAMHDTTVGKDFCIKCQQEREVRSMSVKWFYDQLKTKFRRHGGAKIVRELYKKKRSSSQDSETPPQKPARADQNRYETQEIPSINISEHESESENESDVETQSTLERQHPDMREQMEEAIAAILLPKLEELRQTQNQSNQQQNNKDAVKLAEEILERFLQQGKILLPKHEEENDDDVMMWRYVRDHRDNIMKTIVRKISMEIVDEIYDNLQPHFRTCELWLRIVKGQTAHSDSSVTSLRNAETMTDDNYSDSELDSMRSESMISVGSRKAPLSDRIRSLSPDSLRSSLAQNDMQGMVQGVILHKDQLIARAEVGAAISEMIDENVTPTDAQEFSTELKFTAVGVNESFSPINSRRTSSSTSECSDINEDNWIKKTTNRSLSKSTANTYIPYNVVQSAYDATMTSSDESSDDEVEEEEIQPVERKNSVKEIRTNGSRQCEQVGDILAEEIQHENLALNTEQKSATPIQEVEIVPIDAKSAFRKLIPISNALAAFKSGSVHRNSGDSAYLSEGSSEHNVNKQQKLSEEYDTMSSCSSLDGSLRLTTAKQRSSLLMPAKYTAAPATNKPKPRLKSDNVIFDDDDDFGDRLSDAISRQELKKKEESTTDEESENDVTDEDKYLSSSSSEDAEEAFEEVPLGHELQRIESQDNSTPVKQQNYDVTEEVTHSIELDESIIAKQGIEREDSDTETATSSSASTEIAESLDGVRGLPRNLNGTEDLDGSFGTTIQEIVANLKHAGLEVSQGKYKRSSLNNSLTEPTKKWKVKETDKPNKRLSASETNQQTIKLTGFTVDPANYKEAKPTSRDVSLASLLKSDSVSQEEYQMDSGETLDEKNTTKNIEEISIPSVSERRSLFSKTNDSFTTSQSSNKSSFVEEEIGRQISREGSAPSESSSASSSGSEEDKNDDDVTVIPPRDDEKIPTLAERRSAYIASASMRDVSHESGVTSSPRNRSFSDDDRSSMTSPIQPVPLKRVVNATQSNDDVINGGANHDSGSDVSSCRSSATGRIGYEADLSSVTSDPDFSSPRRKPRSSEVPNVIILEHDVIKEDVATPVNQSPKVPKPMGNYVSDFDRDSPFRGSLTMRGGRMAVDANQKYHHNDDDQPTDDDVTRDRLSPRREPFVMQL